MSQSANRVYIRYVLVALITVFCVFLYSAQDQQTRIAGCHHTAVSPDEAEQNLDGNVTRYTRKQPGSQPDLLWLTLTYDNTSWGHTDRLPKRSIHHFLNILAEQYDTEKISLGLLTSSYNEYILYISATRKFKFANVDIFLHPGSNDEPATSREHRHDAEVQTARRSEMAKLRNYLMLKTLREEQHILWLDADVWRLDPGIVRKMISHSHARQDVGMITARCAYGETGNYDLNAWRGTRQGPRGWDLNEDEIAAGELQKQGQLHVDRLIEGTHDNDLLELDTVGATILYMRASLIWRGVNFPHQYVVGTRWAKDGWDGIESEGLCYRARHLKGGRCMVMGGSWQVFHTPN